ncbi:flagellar hook-length control protein FliK [Marinomonas sp. GJ51-6]|uniref:flagellar hook-length control protein FliK n=1 Tax=Marinomonas sp. GJ51-6 TaxID=2992802 RepID=UPI0029346134|nr:flagellar hook-length control protein FliK [Marinomonas sp. GJ51-6]WOD06588.1 flagellar hook-length control protein FliK [Marinomonas sp. GJ51-6]
MISDIRSTLNANSDKQNMNGTVSSYTGTLAKLTNELKFIENMSLIKFQGSETLNHQGKPVQLLHAISSQQPFTLINTGAPIDLSDIKSAQLNKTNPLQATLTTTKESLPTQTNQPQAAQTSHTENLVLASRVLNLTVISTPVAVTSTANQVTSNSQNNTQPKAPSSNASNPIAPSTTNTQTNNQTNTQPIQTTSANTSAPSPSQVAQGNTTPANSTSGNIPPSNTPFLATVTDGKTEFSILSQTELKRGDVVRVLVDTNNQMQALPPKAEAASLSSHQEALKQSLPKQLSLEGMTQLVRQLSNMSEAPNLPTQTQQALKQLIQSLPTLTGLTSSPEAMKQAIQTSGTFSESLLLQDSKTQLSEDLKLNLTRLKDVQESTGALRLGTVPTEQIANAIERITTTQLRNFSENNQTISPTYPLHIELPIRNGLTQNLVQIEIHKDSSNQEERKQERRWLVKLKFDFEETGKFEASTSIQANKVSIIFIAEETDTLHKLKQNMPKLKEQLRDKDIEVERLDTFQAKLANPEKSPQTHNKPLIDVRT